MSEMKAVAVATLIGDVVGSRRSPDRAALHRRLTAALAGVAADDGVLEPPRVTVGDELQGTYATLGAALQATWRLRAALAPEVDMRFGLGWGPVTALDDEIQDGPGWWDAREAITAVAQEQRQQAWTGLRTAYRSRADDAPDPAAVDAALRCRDYLAGSLDDRSRQILEGLMAGRTQSDIAAEQGISPSAVSQRYRGEVGVLMQVIASLASVGAVTDGTTAPGRSTEPGA